MFRESFYSFLGGPRTFWGGGRTFVNNYFMQPPFSMFGHHHCQGDNGMSKLMGWAYVFNMMQNMVRPQQTVYPPYQPQAYMPQQGAYPYVNFSGVEGAEGVSGEQQSNEDFANLYNMYKNDGYSFGRINGNYYAKAKDGTVYKGSTVEELADKLAEANATDKKEEKTSLEKRLQEPAKFEENNDTDDDNNKVGDNGDTDDDKLGNDGNNSKVKTKEKQAENTKKGNEEKQAENAKKGNEEKQAENVKNKYPKTSGGTYKKGIKIGNCYWNQGIDFGANKIVTKTSTEKSLIGTIVDRDMELYIAGSYYLFDGGVDFCTAIGTNSMYTRDLFKKDGDKWVVNPQGTWGDGDAKLSKGSNCDGGYELDGAQIQIIDNKIYIVKDGKNKWLLQEVLVGKHNNNIKNLNN